MSPTHAKCGAVKSRWAILQTPERGLWVPVREEILVNSVSLACWRGRNVQDRRARTHPSEPRTPVRTESATPTVPPPPGLSSAVGKTPVLPCLPAQGRNKVDAAALNWWKGHILVMAWVGAPPAPEEASHPQSPLLYGQGKETPSLEGPPQWYTEHPDCSMWWPSVTPRAAPEDLVGRGDNLSPLAILGHSLLPQAWDPSQQ